MKMLLASKDVSVLERVAKRLVAAGIPIALCKAAELSAYREVWIQWDSKVSPAGRRRSAAANSQAAAQGPARPLCGDGSQQARARSRDLALAISRIERCLRRLRQLRETYNAEDG